MKQVKALILAGGYGSRLKPITDNIPKCLVTIGEYSLLEYWIRNLIRADIKDIVINTHYLREAVQLYISDANKSHDINIVESFEPKLLGSAGTVTNNKGFAEKSDIIVLIYADNFSGLEIKDIVNFHQSHDSAITMMLFHAENPCACGIVQLDEECVIIDFEEKPKKPKSDLANAGIYVIDSNTYNEIASMNAFDFGFDVLPKYIGRMKGFVFDGYHRDIGDMSALKQARQDLERSSNSVSVQ